MVPTDDLERTCFCSALLLVNIRALKETRRAHFYRVRNKEKNVKEIAFTSDTCMQMFITEYGVSRQLINKDRLLREE